MNQAFRAALFVATVFSFATAQASVIVAELGAVQGKVMINHGKGFVPAVGLISLNVGDQLMVGEESSAVVNYASGCAVSVAATQVVTISAKAPCMAGQSVAMIGDTAIVPAGNKIVGHTSFTNSSIFPIVAIGGVAIGLGALLLLTRSKAASGY